jgi:hypothetical protein
LQWLLTPSVPIENAVLLGKMKLLAGMLLVFIGGSVLYTFLHLTLEKGFALNFFWINGTSEINEFRLVDKNGIQGFRGHHEIKNPSRVTRITFFGKI